MFAKIQLQKYPYITLLSISFLVVALFWKLEPGFVEMSDAEIVEDTISEEVVSAEVVPEWELPETAEVTEVIEEADEVSFFVADRTYFDHALFIGDSRTVGLYEYGDLGNAIALADSGMSVYKVFKQKFELPSGEKQTLEELLSEEQFEKIYIMLGINELGYSFEPTVVKYEKMVERIEELQPDAIIFLQANLHITKSKSGKSEIYNNENIDRFNREVEKLADNKKRFFLDANELFDDEEGNLSVEYTVDEAHVLGKYYVDWVDWILNYAVD